MGNGPARWLLSGGLPHVAARLIRDPDAPPRLVGHLALGTSPEEDRASGGAEGGECPDDERGAAGTRRLRRVGDRSRRPSTHGVTDRAVSAIT
jgi:hypothetical protein